MAPRQGRPGAAVGTPAAHGNGKPFKVKKAKQPNVKPGKPPKVKLGKPATSANSSN